MPRKKTPPAPSPAPSVTALVKTFDHPLRLRIIDELIAGDATSPVAIAARLDESVQLVSYHVRILRDRGLLELTATEPRRGAIEHFYAPTETARAARRAITVLENALNAAPAA